MVMTCSPKPSYQVPTRAISASASSAEWSRKFPAAAAAGTEEPDGWFCVAASGRESQSQEDKEETLPCARVTSTRPEEHKDLLTQCDSRKEYFAHPSQIIPVKDPAEKQDWASCKECYAWYIGQEVSNAQWAKLNKRSEPEGALAFQLAADGALPGVQ